jgi:hypothetical protein
LAHQLERVLAEQRIMRNQLAGIHDQLTTLPSIRDIVPNAAAAIKNPGRKPGQGQGRQ